MAGFSESFEGGADGADVVPGENVSSELVSTAVVPNFTASPARGALAVRCPVPASGVWPNAGELGVTDGGCVLEANVTAPVAEVSGWFWVTRDPNLFWSGSYVIAELWTPDSSTASVLRVAKLGLYVSNDNPSLQGDFTPAFDQWVQWRAVVDPTGVCTVELRNALGNVLSTVSYAVESTGPVRVQWAAVSYDRITVVVDDVAVVMPPEAAIEGALQIARTRFRPAL